MLPASAEETGIPFARSLIRAQTEHRHQAGSAPTERYFISSHSVEETRAQRFAGIVRAHWNIENGSHWQRDTLWREDAHPMRGHTRAHILSTLRQVALHQHSNANASATKPSPISRRAQQAGLQMDQTLKEWLRAS